MSQPQSPEYRVWGSMIQRCTNPNRKDYKHYGSRGVKVCDRWRQSFGAFLADMGPRPSLDHWIERKNNDGGYNPENCLWLLRYKQPLNTRQNQHLTVNGITHVVSEWATITGVNRFTIYSRIKRGFSPEVCISIKDNRKTGMRRTFRGKPNMYYRALTE